MKIAEVVGDMRIMWFNKDGTMGYHKFKPPFKIPIPTEIQVMKPGIMPKASDISDEYLPGYYVIGTDGRLVKIKESADDK